MQLDDQVKRRLRAICESVDETQPRVLARYAHDQLQDRRYHASPALVLFPEHTDEVLEIVRLCAEHRVPLTPRGGGSGLTGGAIPVAGGVVLSLDRMNRIVEVDQENLCATVEAGVVTKDLDAHLEPLGLFFPGYPMSEEICNIGGNVAENAGGGRAIKYGVTGTHVLGLEVVTATGELLRLGGKRLKDVSGYSLIPLFVGSEGTLGIVTRVTLRLSPRPPVRRGLLVSFASAERAAEAIGVVRRQGPSAVEYIDGETARRTASSGARTETRVPGESEALLLVEFDGQEERDVVRPLAAAREALSGCGGTVLVAAETDADLEKLWALRKAVPWYIKRTAGELHSLEDVVVPPAEIPGMVAASRGLAGEHGLEVAVFGHGADGKFHVTPLAPEGMSEALWYERSEAYLADLYRYVVANGGAISGEHGIGRKRVHALRDVTGTAELAMMRRLKETLDPQGILNPGVVL